MKPTLRWWTIDGEPHGEVAAAMRHIAQYDQGRESRLLRDISFYGGAEYLASLSTRFTVTWADDADRLPYNIVESIVDTIHAEVVQQRPRVMFMTVGGDWSARQKAEKLSQYTDGLFASARFDETASRAALDAIATGTGAVKVHTEHGKVCIERVSPGEIFVDPKDGYDGYPRSLYHLKHIDRAVLQELFPKHEDKIARASSPDDFGWSDSEADQVQVIEAWHLRSGPEANDGRHVIAIDGATLLDEEWERDTFPFAFLRWKIPLFGFWGTSVATQLDGLQCEVNRVGLVIQDAHHLMGSPFFMAPRSARITKQHLMQNEVGRFVEYDGQIPPTVWVGSAVPRETLELRDRYVARGYEQVGVSQLAASSMKPAGLDSGIALRTYLDNQSKRFVAFTRSWEQFYVDVAELCVEAMRDLAADDSAYDVVYRDGETATKIQWSEVDMDRDAYALRTFPISALANSPSGRLQQLQELFQGGVIDRDMFLELSNMPDFDSQRKTLTAPRELIEKRIYLMLQDGKYRPPNTLMNLQLALLLGGLSYQRAELEGVPEERLALIRDFLADTVALLEQAAPPAEAPPLPEGAPTEPAPPPDLPPEALQ